MAGTLVANTINTDTGLYSTNNAYLGIAKAWVNFTGSTAVIRASFNVSSITRNAAGDYTVNFSTTMADANYSQSVNVAPNYAVAWSLSPALNQASGSTQSNPTTSSFRFNTPTSSGALYDPIFVNVIVCGN